MQNTGNVYSFISQSNDFRFLEAHSFLRINYPACEFGRPFAYIVLGMATPLIISIPSRSRTPNPEHGSHRAYALRDIGLTHVPCLVSEDKPKR